MHGLGFNRFASRYLSAVKVDAAGTLPSITTPWVINKFAADFFACMRRVVYAAYPYIGGNAAAHAVDLFGNHTLTWTGSVTHNANGITGDGSTGYGQMDVNLNEIVLNTLYSHGGYCRTNSAANIYDYGCASGSGTAMVLQAKNAAGDAHGWASLVTVSTSAAVATSTGFYVVTRPSLTSNVAYKNGVTIASIAGVSGALASAEFTVSAYWSKSVVTYYYSNRNFAFHFIGGYTVVSHATLYNLVQALQTHLGRQV